MAPNQQLQFLREKIQEIKSAILFNLSDSVLKFPTTIVSTVKTDDFGYLYFFVRKPKQDIREFEKEFPVRLDYFKKGKECFLQIMGKAWVVTDPEEITSFISLNEDVANEFSEDMVLVKVKMMKADYQETPARSSNGLWANTFGHIFTWFKSSAYRPSTYFQAS